MQEGNLVRDCPPRGRARGMKRLVNEVLWNLTLTEAKTKTGSLCLGSIPSVRIFGLGVLIATVFPLLSAGYPVMQADANQFSETVTYKPKKNWKEITTTVTMDLFGPGEGKLPAGLKKKLNLYWLQISVKPTVEIDFEFDVYGHNVLKKGSGHWISAMSPGEVMIAVEDQKASLGRLQKLYYRETEGYSDTKFRDYSKLATSTEEWPTDYHKTFGRYHDPDFKTVTDQLQDFWGSLKKKIPGFKEAVPVANYLLGYHPMLGPALSTLQMWPLVTEVMKTTPEWVFTTKIPGVYRDGSDVKLREPLPVFSDDKNFDIHTYSWPFLLRSSTGPARARAPNQISKLNYFFELHRENPEETLLYIRAIIPHHVVSAGGTPEKWIEIEWEQLLPALKEIPAEQERYQLIPRWKTWEEARDDCEKRGGHLVTIDSDEENEIVTQLLTDGGYPHAWIGLSDKGKGETNRKWEWVTTANMKNTSYRKWGENQPDALKEYYVDIRSDGTWNDWCRKYNPDPKTTKYKMPSVCEFEPMKSEDDLEPAKKKGAVTEPEEPEGKHPTVVIWVTPEEVRVGETFKVYLEAKDDVELQSMWWKGKNTGIPQLDKKHTARLFGKSATSHWPITATEQGTFILVADARDRQGHQASEGQETAEATITVRAPIPSVPSKLGGTAVCFRRVDLTWHDDSNDEKGFHIYRKTTDKYTRLASVSSNTTTYTDTTVEPETTYLYKATAYNDAGESEPSNEVSVTTPSVPAQATLTLASAFDDRDGDVSKYHVEIELNGHLIYSGYPGVGTSPLEHGRWGKKADSGFQNLKHLEILFDRKLLGGGKNDLKVTLSGVDRLHWFCWESLMVDCIELPYEHYKHRARIHDTTYQSFVHGGETYSSTFTLPQK
jgi:hypothetical protein